MSRYVYVAGPYTGDEEGNVARALVAATALLKAGLYPYVPHLSHYWEAQHAHHYEVWMELDFGWVRRCDAVLRLPGPSSGADREVELAERLGLPVFRDVESVVAWAKWNPGPRASAPAPVESAPGAYCTRCHMTEALHHQPNIYTGKKDGRGNPYPQPCDAFTPPAEPGTCRECRRTGVALTPDGYCKTCFVAGCGTGRRDTPPLPAEPGTCPVHKEHKAQQVDRPCRKCGTGPVFFHDGMGSTTTDEHWWCLKCGAEGYVDGIDS